MTDGLSRFTSDRRTREESSWTGEGDWAAGTAEDVDLVDGSLVPRAAGGVGDTPDSVVNLSFLSPSTAQVGRGLIIESNNDWDEIGVELGPNADGFDTLSVFTLETGEFISSKDVSGLSGGQTTAIGGPIVKSVKYGILLEASGTLTYDYHDSVDLPIESNDGDLRVIGGTDGKNLEQRSTIYSFTKVGNVGFE